MKKFLKFMSIIGFCNFSLIGLADNASNYPPTQCPEIASFIKNGDTIISIVNHKRQSWSEYNHSITVTAFNEAYINNCTRNGCNIYCEYSAVNADGSSTTITIRPKLNIILFFNPLPDSNWNAGQCFASDPADCAFYSSANS